MSKPYKTKLSFVRRSLTHGVQYHKARYLFGSQEARHTLLDIMGQFADKTRFDYAEIDIVLLARKKPTYKLTQYVVEVYPPRKQKFKGQIHGVLHGIEAPFTEHRFIIGEHGEIIKFLGLPKSYREGKQHYEDIQD